MENLFNAVLYYLPIPGSVRTGSVTSLLCGFGPDQDQSLADSGLVQTLSDQSVSYSGQTSGTPMKNVRSFLCSSLHAEPFAAALSFAFHAKIFFFYKKIC